MRRLTYGTVALLLALGACRPEGDGRSDSAEADAASASDAAGLLPDPCADPWTCSGFIALSEEDWTLMGAEGFAGFGRFRHLSPTTKPTTVATFGECDVEVGDSSYDIDEERYDVGQVFVTGATSFPMITFERDPLYGWYDSDLPGGPGPIDVWSDGDSLRFVVEGGPDFGAVDFTVTGPPSAAVLLSPVSPVTIPIDADLSVTWELPATPGDQAAVYIRPEWSDTAVSCLGSDDGAMVVPADALAYLAPGPAFFFFGRSITRSTTGADGKPVDIFLSDDVIPDAVLQ